MHARSAHVPHDDPHAEAERIALAYRLSAGGDAGTALVRAIEDALTDLADAERRLVEQRRSVSVGYVRGRAEAR